MSGLALCGGSPVRTEPWPLWPPSSPEIEAAVLDVLRSGRWTISGFTNGRPAAEEAFEEAFCRFLEVPHCVVTDHGTSALELAFAALGIGPGDEVIVPGLTWVACPSAVLSQQAIPILTDIHPETMCLDPAAVERAVGPATRALLIVHTYCRNADMAALLSLAERHELAVVEDCAQAHGARWRGRRVGALGAIGTFSMQQGKPLTSGEGGCCVTRDAGLAELIYRIRTDGRDRSTEHCSAGLSQLVERGGVVGRNCCISDLQLAMLIAQLGGLDEQNARRRSNARYLGELLAELPGVSTPGFHEATDEEVYYHFAFFLDDEFLRGREIDWVGRALTAELGTWVHQPYVPLSRHPLYSPEAREWVRHDSELRRRARKSRFELPNAEEVFGKTLLLHHSVLLAQRGDMETIAEAMAKIRAAVP